MTCFKF